MSHFLIAQQREWLLEHAEQKNGKWFCKKTGAPINSKAFYYDLYNPSLGGPQFEQRVHPQDEGAQTHKVIALWCTHCGVEPKKKPSIAIPEEIIEVVG